MVPYYYNPLSICNILLHSQACLQAIEAMYSSDVSMDSLLLLCNYADGTSGKLYSQLYDYLAPLKKDPVLPLLSFKEPVTHSLKELFEEAEGEKGPEATARLIQAILLAQVESPFHKFNVHAAMTPLEIKKLFEPVFSQAKNLHNIYQQKVPHLREATMSSWAEFTASQCKAGASLTFSATTDLDMTPFVTVRTATIKQCPSDSPSVLHVGVSG